MKEHFHSSCFLLRNSNNDGHSFKYTEINTFGTPNINGCYREGLCKNDCGELV